MVKKNENNFKIYLFYEVIINIGRIFGLSINEDSSKKNKINCRLTNSIYMKV